MRYRGGGPDLLEKGDYKSTSEGMSMKGGGIKNISEGRRSRKHQIPSLLFSLKRSYLYAKESYVVRPSLNSWRYLNKKRKTQLLIIISLFLCGCFSGGLWLLTSRYPCLYYCPWTGGIITNTKSRFLEPGPLPDRTYYDRVQHIQKKVRKDRKYTPIKKDSDTFNVFDCPLVPPADYPREYPIMDVLTSWPTNDTNKWKGSASNPRDIHQGLCIFDFATTTTTNNKQGQEINKENEKRLRQQIKNYQQAELPFVVRNDPEALKSSEKWNTGNYLDWKLRDRVFRGEFSEKLSMLYWHVNKNNRPENFIPPTTIKPLTYDMWYDMAVSHEHNLTKYKENAYLRFDSCLSKTGRCDAIHRAKGMDRRRYSLTQASDADFVFDDLPFFNPKYPELSSSYLVEPEKQRGIQCRFGATGMVAEDHFDNDRNFIALVGGERRYIIGKPSNCKDMSLYPQAHPFERHSKVDWEAPNITAYPSFQNVNVSEVVLQAADILYLPTYWFHHIISLSKNYQCNVRSGHTLEYDQEIYDCGFLYLWPDEGMGNSTKKVEEKEEEEKDEEI